MTPEQIIAAAETQLLTLALQAREHGHNALALRLYEHANHIVWDAPRIPGVGDPLPPEVSRQITHSTVACF